MTRAEKDITIARQKAWRERNHERLVLYSRRHYAKNPKRRMEVGKAYRQRHPERYKLTVRASNLRRKFSVTIAQYDKMFANQNGCCIICKSPLRGNFGVDHDHETKRVRGIACNWCNSYVLAKRNTPEILRLAADYLESTFDGRTI